MQIEVSLIIFGKKYMKIISWNVNSIRVRVEHFLHLIKKYNPDILLLQETRVEDIKFPFECFEETGYNIEIFGQKGRNGVAIFSKYPIEEVRKDFCEEARYIDAFSGGIYIASVYVPNGQFVNSDQYYYKLDFINGLCDRFFQFKDEFFIAGGDFNITPFPSDAYDHTATGITCSQQEREALKKIRDIGFIDLLSDKGYTWWDYRSLSFKKNLGLRIDHFYSSSKMQNLFLNGDVLKNIRSLTKSSDHAPIICEIQK